MSGCLSSKLELLSLTLRAFELKKLTCHVWRGKGSVCLKQEDIYQSHLLFWPLHNIASHGRSFPGSKRGSHTDTGTAGCLRPSSIY